MQAVAWYEELARIAGNGAKLSPHARRAVRTVVAAILSEGEKRPSGLEYLLAALSDD